MTNKVSDFYITLKLENVEGEPVRANSVSDLKVKVFTSDINSFVEFSDITISDKEDRLYIDYDLLSDLKSGVICYTYSYKVADPNFKDKYFNSINTNYTNFYLRQTTLVGKDADLSQNEILAICDRKLVEQYKELKTLIETSTPKIEIDKELKDSENPVANKVINLKFDDIDNTITQIKNTTPKISIDTELNRDSDNPVANRVIDKCLKDTELKIMEIERDIPKDYENDIQTIYMNINNTKYNLLNQIRNLKTNVDTLSKKVNDLINQSN